MNNLRRHAWGRFQTMQSSMGTRSQAAEALFQCILRAAMGHEPTVQKDQYRAGLLDGAGLFASDIGAEVRKRDNKDQCLWMCADIPSILVPQGHNVLNGVPDDAGSD